VYIYIEVLARLMIQILWINFDIYINGKCLYIASACYGNEDKGVMIAAVSEALWENGAACGRMYSVTCTGPTNQGVLQPCRGTVTVKVVDRCPGCDATNIDLSQEAFSAIGNPNAGKININYNG
jgi:hypothetical protein